MVLYNLHPKRPHLPDPASHRRRKIRQLLRRISIWSQHRARRAGSPGDQPRHVHRFGRGLRDPIPQRLEFCQAAKATRGVLYLLVRGYAFHPYEMCISDL